MEVLPAVETIKTIYYIIGISVVLIGFLTQYLWMRFEVKQMRKDMETSLIQTQKESAESDLRIENTRLNNVKALREIYDAKIQDSKNYAKGLFEQRADSINNLQIKVDKIEQKLESMPTQKSVDEINERLTSLISLIMNTSNLSQKDQGL